MEDLSKLTSKDLEALLAKREKKNTARRWTNVPPMKASVLN